MLKTFFYEGESVMKRRMLVFVGLFLLSGMSFSVSAAHKNAKRNVIQNATVRQLLSSSIGSVVMGGCVGAAIGGGIGYIQNGTVNFLNIESSLLKLLLTAASCTLGSELCSNTVASVQSGLDGDQITYNSDLMTRAAFIAAVLVYLNA